MGRRLFPLVPSLLRPQLTLASRHLLPHPAAAAVAGGAQLHLRHRGALLRGGRGAEQHGDGACRAAQRAAAEAHHTLLPAPQVGWLGGAEWGGWGGLVLLQGAQLQLSLHGARWLPAVLCTGSSYKPARLRLPAHTAPSPHPPTHPPQRQPTGTRGTAAVPARPAAQPTVHRLPQGRRDDAALAGAAASERGAPAGRGSTGHRRGGAHAACVKARPAPGISGSDSDVFDSGRNAAQLRPQLSFYAQAAAAQLRRWTKPDRTDGCTDGCQRPAET